MVGLLLFCWFVYLLVPLLTILKRHVRPKYDNLIAFGAGEFRKLFNLFLCSYNSIFNDWKYSLQFIAHYIKTSSTQFKVEVDLTKLNLEGDFINFKWIDKFIAFKLGVWFNKFNEGHDFINFTSIEKYMNSTWGFTS